MLYESSRSELFYWTLWKIDSSFLGKFLFNLPRRILGHTMIFSVIYKPIDSKIKKIEIIYKLDVTCLNVNNMIWQNIQYLQT